jgi:hypothetical protein
MILRVPGVKRKDTVQRSVSDEQSAQVLYDLVCMCT